MGIKFRCPNGHKLNVKSFLAGKRGLCPHCGAKVEIPAEAEPVANAPAESVAQHAAMHTAIPAVAGAATALPAASAVAHPAVTSAPVAAPAVATQVEQTPGTLFGVAQVATAGHVAASDPIAEAPSAVWYVRPPSGGQFGPAVGDIMRRWIAEGRVNGQSLVWREGWPDWKPAASLFPSISGGQAQAANVAQPTPVATEPTALNSSSPRKAYPRRRNSKSFAVTVVVILTVASMALLGALFYVLQL